MMTNDNDSITLQQEANTNIQPSFCDTSLAATYETINSIPTSSKDQINLQTLWQHSNPICPLNLDNASGMLDCIESIPSGSGGTIGKNKLKKKEEGRRKPYKHAVASTVFPASFIKIGCWQKVHEKEGDLIVKWEHTNRNMVWEFLEGDGKKKIELPWMHILSFKAVCQTNEAETLEVELSRPPKFYVNRNYQNPRAHPLWLRIPDFTQNQASLNRRHYLQFSQGELGRYIEKLMKDEHMLTLSRNPFPTSNDFYFRYPRSHNLYLQSLVQLMENNPQTHVNLFRNTDQSGGAGGSWELGAVVQSFVEDLHKRIQF